MKNLKPYVWLVALALSAAAPAQTKIALTEPKVSAASAIAIDAESGKILWQKNADASRFPASTTKIMTAMLLIENCTADEVIVAPPDIEKVGESSMHLKPGERITAADMLYALMLRSANDGCVAVADHIAGSVPKFVEMMNAKAKALGCTNTHFDNPNGLNDPKHTTTAHDLALIARAAMRYPIFEQVVRTTKHVIKRDPKISRDDLMFNHDKLLMKDPSADGIKTGWTIPAGRCFVGSATRDGYRVITVVLKSQDWQKDDQILLNWAFADHNREYAFRPGQMLGPLPVEGGTSPSVELVPAYDPVHIWRKDAAKNLQVKFDHPAEVMAPVKKGQKLGQVVLTDEDGFTQAVDLLAAQEVKQTVAAHIVGKAEATPSFVFIGGCLTLGAFYMRAKTRRRFRPSKAIRHG
ncbi:MAG TPA: D-alanyl-D-alanine carboxypeptidase family protein [Fimbriimonadaceae bacterium]|nr:D-alanyl-D-alanine carboxypeptidase family protein [Fimbriimonadaceae bacterium]